MSADATAAPAPGARNAPAPAAPSRLRVWWDQHLHSVVFSLGRALRKPWATLLTVAVMGLALALPLGLSILPESQANVGDAFVVSDRYAAISAVRTLSDLAKASEAVPITLGGPPECVSASWCKRFLEDEYGVRIAEFIPLDAGGALSRAAVDSGEVDVVWLSGNDGGIEEFGLTALADDLGRAPINPITPVMQQRSVNPDVARVVNRVSAALTTEAVRDANLRVEFEREEMQDVVQEFLEENGLKGIELAERSSG